MEPWQERLVADFGELDERIKKLERFLGGTDFAALPDEDRWLLRFQRDAMVNLSNVLVRRIERSRRK